MFYRLTLRFYRDMFNNKVAELDEYLGIEEAQEPEPEPVDPEQTVIEDCAEIRVVAMEVIVAVVRLEGVLGLVRSEP